jgi:methionyl-tRNA formyltransferase
MRLIYFGTGSFALPALRALAEHVVLVVTQPDRPTGRGMKMQPSPAKLLGQELGIPVESPEKTRAPEFVARLREFDADALVVASYGQILSTAVLESAKRGGINLHGSILPEYRGAAPIQRCILDGRSETGITLMQMDRGMDTGDQIEIVRTPIGPDETYGELQDRLALIAAEMAVDWMPRIVAGDYPRTPQDSSKATIAPKIMKSEAELRFAEHAAQEYNRFRAFTPAPGAFMKISGGTLRIHQARLAEGQGAAGELLSLSPEPVVAFGNGAIRLIEVQPEGKRRMSARDWANGARLKVGDSLI